MIKVDSTPNEKDLLAAIQKVKATSPERIRIVFVSHKAISALHSYDHVNEIMEFYVGHRDGYFDSFIKSGKLSKRLINHFYPAIQRCTKVRVEGLAPQADDSHMT